MRKPQFLLFLVLSVFATHAAAESLWTCEAILKGVNKLPPRNKITVKVSDEIRFFDDGTILVDNHISPSLITGIYYAKGRKVWVYPDRDAVTQGLYDEMPGISDVHVTSNYLIFKFKGPMDQAQTAKVRGHVDEQFLNTNGSYIRVVANGKGRCERLY